MSKKAKKKIPVKDLKFKPVEIDRSREVEIDDNEGCMFCKKPLCECPDNAPFGYVKKELRDYKIVGDLALARRDSFSKWEKEAKDKEYADSSRLAAKKLELEKKPHNGLSMSEEKRNKVFKSPESIERYIKYGDY